MCIFHHIVMMFPVSRIIDKMLCYPSTGSATDHVLSVSCYWDNMQFILMHAIIKIKVDTCLLIFTSVKFYGREYSGTVLYR